MELNKINLQIFSEATQGNQLLYLFRILKNAKTNSATLMAFASSGERSVSKSASTKATKSGTIRTPGSAEIQITSTAVMMKGDPLADELETAMLNDELIECWEINRAEKDSTGKYKAKYYQGYMTEFKVSSSSGETAEYSITYGANGNGADGYATLSAEQEEAANYVFADTTKGA